MSVPGQLPPLLRRDPVRVELVRVSMPLRTPVRAAHGTETSREAIVVTATDAEGHTGWGECDALTLPTYTGEWVDGAWLVLSRYLAPAALGQEAPEVRGHPMATAALEGACIDLALRAEGRSLAQALGGERDRVVSRAVVGISAPEEAVASVADRLAAGHRAVKLKVRPGDGLAAVGAVVSTWPGLDVAVDANGSFDAHRDADELRRIDQAGLSYLEQPLAPGDLVGHAALRRQLDTPLALDESVPDLGSLDAALALGALDRANLKPARLGGLENLRCAAARARDAGVDAFCGGMYELGIGRATTLAAATAPGMAVDADLGPSSAYVDDDLTAPLELAEDGTLLVPRGPGWGPAPRAARIDAVARDRIVLVRA